MVNISEYRNTFLYFIFSFGLSLGCIASNFDAKSLDEWLLKTHKVHNLAGMTATIVQDGKVVFNQSYGVIDIETAVPTTPQHLFAMASVSKTVVAVAIMQLVEQGKIKLDAPVNQYLPYFKLNDNRLNQVTIKNLLTHASGMPDTGSFQFKNPQNDEKALERWVKEQANKKLLFDPEENLSYSNIGYDILGDVIAKVSGVTFEKYIKNRIFAPLGMKLSTFLRNEVPANLRVKAHSGILNTFPLDYYPYNRRHAPSVSYHTNGDEMAIWLNAFSNEKRLVETGILKAETLKEMWSTIPNGRREGWGIAFGWVKTTNDKRTTYSNDGDFDGFSSYMAVYGDRDGGYGLMINKNHVPTEKIVIALQQATENQPLPPIPDITEKQKVAKLFDDKGNRAIVSYFGNALAKGWNDENSNPVYSLLFDFHLSGSFQQIEDLSEAIINTYGDQQLAYVYLGHAKYDLNKTDEAMAIAKKALNMKPNDGAALRLIKKINDKTNR